MAQKEFLKNVTHLGNAIKACKNKCQTIIYLPLSTLHSVLKTMQFLSNYGLNSHETS